jgi:SAM-dependent methyltransferase
MPVQWVDCMLDKIIAFEKNVAKYDAWFEKNREIFSAELEAIKGFIPSFGKGVEIGVGTGRFAASLGITIGVEPSPGMAELARQRGVEVIEGVAEVLPFAEETFNFILMVTVDCFLGVCRT